MLAKVVEQVASIPQFIAEDAFIESSEQAYQENCDSFSEQKLFQLLYREVNKKAPINDGQALDRILTPLFQTLLLQTFAQRPNARKYLKGDFTVFTYFMQLLNTPTSIPVEKINLQQLWPEGMDFQKRYADIMHCLLNQVKPSLTQLQSLSLKTIHLSLEQFERLVQLSLSHAYVPKNSIFSMTDLFHAWLAHLVDCLNWLFKNKHSPDNPLYGSIGVRMFQIIKQFETTDDKLRNQALLALHAWNNAGKVHYAAKPLCVKAYLSAVQSTSLYAAALRKYRFNRFNGWNYLSSLEKDLEKDLDIINQFALYSLRSALANNATETEMLAMYLNAYQNLNQRLKEWFQDLMQLRMRLEKDLRTHRFYLDGLSRLDAIIFSMQEKSECFREAWLQATKEHHLFSPTILEQLINCISIFSHPDVRKLSWANWIHHTCYAFQRSEGEMAHEMHTRNIKANFRYFNERHQDRFWEPSYSYDIETVYTLTDFAVDQLQQVIPRIGQLFVKVHPDKVDPILRDTANAIMKEILSLRNNASEFVSRWQLGQWNHYPAAPKGVLLLEDNKSAAPAVPTEDGFDEPEPTFEQTEYIMKPTVSLDAAAFATLHKAYLNRLYNSNPGEFHKVSLGMGFADRLYMLNDDNDFKRKLVAYGNKSYVWQMRKQAYVSIQRARAEAKHDQLITKLKQVKAETAQAKAEAAQVKAEAAQVKAEAAQAKAEAAQVEERAVNILKNVLKQALMNCFKEQLPDKEEDAIASFEQRIEESIQQTQIIDSEATTSSLQAMALSILRENAEFRHLKDYIDKAIDKKSPTTPNVIPQRLGLFSIDNPPSTRVPAAEVSVVRRL